MNPDGWGSAATEDVAVGIREPSSLDNVDDQLEQLEKSISILRGRLVHVSLERAEKEMSSPTPAPRSPLAARALRIRESCQAVERLIEGLDI